MISRRSVLFITLLFLVAGLVVACGSEPVSLSEGVVRAAPLEMLDEDAAPAEEGAATTEEHVAASGETIRFTLETVMEDGFAFRGIGGVIDGVVNPELRVPAGAQVEITTNWN